jgi:flagellar operon protein
VSSAVPNAALIAPGPVGAIQPTVTPATAAGAAQATNGPSFQELLAKQTSSLQFSRHALQRLQQRGIQLDQPTLGRLTDGVQRAASKGSRDSVVFVDGTAYVVSVSNNTVITAVSQEQMHQQVFTNIDSAVIA